MALNERLDKYKALARVLKDQAALNERVLTVAAKATEGVFKQRIFKEGKDANGALIGDYDTKPFYINPKSPSLVGVKKGNLKPIGKTGQKKFKDGTPHKTTYLPNGYKELREKTGRQSAKVDLNLSGASAASIQTGKRGNFVVLGFTNLKRALILEGNERRFGKRIFAISAKERQVFANAAADEIQKIVKQITQK